MITIRNTDENEMILEFLKGELNSKRFNEKLSKTINLLNLNRNIISNGNLNNPKENKSRLEIMKNYRGYPNNDMFNNFPNITKWKYVQFEKEDINKIYYIDYDYWNELSNFTSLSSEAAKNINNDIEIYQVSNNAYLDGIKYLKNHVFPPIILITCNNKKFLIIEGHSRMTVYGLVPDKFNNSYGFIGYCSENDMKKYDKRMI